MKVWRLEKAGGRLSLEQVPVPSVRPGTALVRLSAAPVLSYMGDVLAGKVATIYRFPDHPFTPGTNGAGTVEAVGPAVFHLRAGQRVVLNPHFVADERGVDPAQILIGLTRIGPDSALEVMVPERIPQEIRYFGNDFPYIGRPVRISKDDIAQPARDTGNRRCA
jgi:alcohol dehydrogenase